MKISVLFLCLFCCILIKAQNNSAGRSIDTIYSAILNEDRYLWVQVPAKISGISHNPVIYVLDGQVLFDEVNNVLNRLSDETERNAANDMIVVGLGNIGERYRDYSPTHIASSAWVDSYSASISGGGDKFISFLANELFPYINSKYSDSPIRIIIGHSMGGLMVMNILLKHPDMFNHYAAIDPSMWWDDQKLLNESKTILSEKELEKRSLFLAVANTKEMDMDVSQIKKDTSETTVLIRPSLTLVDYITNNKQNKLNFVWKYYNEYHHMTVPAPAIYDALKFFLKY